MAKNIISLGDDQPLDNYLKPIKVGGEVSMIEISSPPSLRQRSKMRISGDLEVLGDVRSDKFMSIINGGFYSTSTSVQYLPLTGSIREAGSLTGGNEYSAFAPPYKGRVVRMVVRSEAAAGSTIAGLHISNEGTEVPATGIVSGNAITVDMSVDDTAYVFEFPSATATFVVGDVIALSLNTTAAIYDAIFSIVLEYDIINRRDIG